MKDHIEKGAGLEAAAAGLVLRELTDAETGDVVALVLQPPAQDVEDDLLADVTEVRRCLDGQAAVVDGHLAVDERDELAHGASGGVIQLEGHRP